MRLEPHSVLSGSLYHYCSFTGRRFLLNQRGSESYPTRERGRLVRTAVRVEPLIQGVPRLSPSATFGTKQQSGSGFQPLVRKHPSYRTADIPVCRFADFLVGRDVTRPGASRFADGPAGLETCGTAASHLWRSGVRPGIACGAEVVGTAAARQEPRPTDVTVIH